MVILCLKNAKGMVIAMNEVNKTLYIPLYGKAKVSKQGIILKDAMAEKIWDEEAFPIHGKSKSKWLAYNMVMRARVFDDWTEAMLMQHQDALVVHIGCGLDGRYLRVSAPYTNWIDADFGEVIALRKKYYTETENYHMTVLDASSPEQLKTLPDSKAAIIVLEGLSMYLTNAQVNSLFCVLKEKYTNLYILMDVYTEFGARASKYKNPVNDVGVTTLYGIDDIEAVLRNTGISLTAEHSFTPDYLVNELKPLDRAVFKLLFTEGLYRKIYRLYELTLSK